MNAARLKRFGLLIVACVLAASWSGAETADAQKERATVALEQALKADPNNAELWVHLGFAQRKQGQMDASQSSFEQALQKDPRNQDALYMLGLIYESKHQKPEALRMWQQYLGAATDPAKRSVAENHIHQLGQ